MEKNGLDVFIVSENDFMLNNTDLNERIEYEKNLKSEFFDSLTEAFKEKYSTIACHVVYK